MCPPPLPLYERPHAAAGGACSRVEYISHHGNVKNRETFGVPYFKTFDVVMNALDNVDARRHVNRVCLAANVPIVEAGTTGYLGQVRILLISLFSFDYAWH